MALRNLFRTSFWTGPTSFSRNLCALDNGNHPSHYSTLGGDLVTKKWWTKNLDLENVNCDVDHARRHFHACNSLLKREDLSRKQMALSMPKQDDGTLGENLADFNFDQQTGLFPDENSANRLFDGVRYADLPICNIKASPNNTVMTITDSAGVVKANHSCGMEGFKNTREGTNIAAQAAAITLASKGLGLGIKNVRVTVSGLGPGRMAAIKGLTMGGINVISITDRTPVPWVPFPRPKKRRRL
nr:EOG090X0DZ9 [Macrothrix elegans]